MGHKSYLMAVRKVLPDGCEESPLKHTESVQKSNSCYKITMPDDCKESPPWWL